MLRLTRPSLCATLAPVALSDIRRELAAAPRAAAPSEWVTLRNPSREAATVRRLEAAAWATPVDAHVALSAYYKKYPALRGTTDAFFGHCAAAALQGGDAELNNHSGRHIGTVLLPAESAHRGQRGMSVEGRAARLLDSAAQSTRGLRDGGYVQLDTGVEMHLHRGFGDVAAALGHLASPAGAALYMPAAMHRDELWWHPAALREMAAGAVTVQPDFGNTPGHAAQLLQLWSNGYGLELAGLRPADVLTTRTALGLRDSLLVGQHLLVSHRGVGADGALKDATIAAVDPAAMASTVWAGGAGGAASCEALVHALLRGERRFVQRDRAGRLLRNDLPFSEGAIRDVFTGLSQSVEEHAAAGGSQRDKSWHKLVTEISDLCVDRDVAAELQALWTATSAGAWKETAAVVAAPGESRQRKGKQIVLAEAAYRDDLAAALTNMLRESSAAALSAVAAARTAETAGLGLDRWPPAQFLAAAIPGPFYSQ